MIQILNLLSFLMELTFGRDANASRTRSQTIRAMLFMFCFFASLYSNYHLLATRYTTTAKYIAIKKQFVDQETLLKQFVLLENHVVTLEMIIGIVSPNTAIQRPPDLLTSEILKTKKVEPTKVNKPDPVPKKK